MSIYETGRRGSRRGTHAVHSQKQKVLIFSIKSPISHLYPEYNPAEESKNWQKGKHTLAEVLKHCRIKNRLFQKQLARKFGVTEDAYRFWEEGLTLPTPEKSSKLREFLGGDAEYLQDKFTELKQQAWTSKQVCEMLKINPHTLQSWITKQKCLSARHSVSRNRLIFTKVDIENIKRSLGKRIEAIRKRKPRVATTK